MDGYLRLLLRKYIATHDASYAIAFTNASVRLGQHSEKVHIWIVHETSEEVQDTISLFLKRKDAFKYAAEVAGKTVAALVEGGVASEDWMTQFWKAINKKHYTKALIIFNNWWYDEPIHIYWKSVS